MCAESHLYNTVPSEFFDMADPKTRPHLLLVDGSAYLHRSYHVHTSLTDHKGRPTGAIFGVINTLQKQLRLTSPDYVAIVMDAPGKNFRHDLYPEYKANRKPMEEDLRSQIEPLHQIIEAQGLPLVVVPDVEADDVIGTLAHQGEADGMDVIVLSGDKDMAQLVTDHVTLLDIDRPPMNAARVMEKFEVRPDQFIDFLTLAGDAVDNIPGVPKVGYKTAAKWLRQYDSLANLVENVDEIKGKAGENLRDSLDRLPLYRELVTIRLDVELDWTLRDLVRGPQDCSRLGELYEEYALRSFLRELRTSNEVDPGNPDLLSRGNGKKNYATVLDLEELDQWLARAHKAGTFAVDTETTGLDPNHAGLVGVSLATAPGEAAYIPVGHVAPDSPPQLAWEQVRQRLQPLLTDPKLVKVGHNLQYDLTILRRHGVEIGSPFHDSMLESYVHHSTASRHNLDDLSRVYLGEETIRYKEVAGTGKKQVSFDMVPISLASPYAAEDADMTLRLHHHLWPRLQEIPSLQKIYEEMEMPLSEVLADMERTGVAINAAALREQSGELREELEALKKEIAEECGQELNLNSVPDLQRVLFEERGLKPLRKTPKGAPSTAEDVLEILAEQDVLPRMILNYRQSTKLLSTYVGKLPEMINPETGRLHASFHQAVTATGRLSSSNPNLQNIPIRTEQGRRVRQAFVARPGDVLIAADYSQIELRIMAHISRDPTLCRAFEEGGDVHRATAAEVFGIAPGEVTEDQRRTAKAINFGLMYGMSGFGLARQLRIARDKAETYVTTYFDRYPEVLGYMEQMREQARKRGFVETVFGRRLYIEGIDSRNYNQRQYAERTAINAPMQGTAADIIKLAMIDVHRWLKERHSDCFLLMQVHDELVLEVPREKVEEITEGVRERMIGVAGLDVPMMVDARHGDNWEQAH